MAQIYAEIGFEGLPDDVEVHYVLRNAHGQEDRAILGLGGVNLFVGKNNSGKSRLLRALYKAQELRGNPPTVQAGAVNSELEKVKTRLADVFRGSLKSYGGLNAQFLDPVMPGRFFDTSKAAQQLSSIRDRLAALVRDPPQNPSFMFEGHATADDVFRAHRDVKPIAEAALESIRGVSVSIGEEPRVYIPVLRGLRPLAPGQENKYAQRTKDDYGAPDDGRRHFIFTGIDFHAQLAYLQNAEPELRKAADEYEQFLSAEFFEGVHVDLTPRTGSDVVHIRIGRAGSDIPVYNLGDGMQSMIVLTFKAFTADAPSLFFIEEPELHLHPGFQRRILDLFGRSDRLGRHQYFITTHSNHLLDMAVDNSGWSTYVFRKEREGAFEVLPLEGQNKLALHELGARSSSVFLTNASVWVEGVTDRLYLRTYLLKFQKDMREADRMREDMHFSFIEYGGANVTHWDFTDSGAFSDGIRVASICSDSMLIADGDVETKGERAETLRTQLGERFVALDCKEIENLLPENIVRGVAGTKSKDAALIDSVRADEYQRPNIPLGKYLDDKLGPRALRLLLELSAPRCGSARKLLLR